MKEERRDTEGECTIPSHPVPAQELHRYSVDRDPHSEQDIARYVSLEAPDELVMHVEKVKSEAALGDVYVIWDVTTDKDRWWVITNLTNLYSQKHFPSLDYTLSFHIGLMMRLRSRSHVRDVDDPSPFDELFRRMDQAEKRHEASIEVEDFQAVGMLLREALISLIWRVRERIELPDFPDAPLKSDFVGWSRVLVGHMSPGASNKELRMHVRNIAASTWQLVNWLTHARNSDRTASSIALHACQTVLGHLLNLSDRTKNGPIERCPTCASRDVRTHYDHLLEPPDYFQSCGVCTWSNHPSVDVAGQHGATSGDPNIDSP